MNRIERPAVVVVSPLRASPQRTMEIHERFARRLCRVLSRHGYATYAGHLYCTQFLDEFEPADRQAGIETNLVWIERSDIVMVWDTWGISTGMAAEIEYARFCNARRIEDHGAELRSLISIRYFTKGEIPEWTDLGGLGPDL